MLFAAETRRSFQWCRRIFRNLSLSKVEKKKRAKGLLCRCNRWFPNLLLGSFSKRVVVLIFSCEIEFSSRANETHFWWTNAHQALLWDRGLGQPVTCFWPSVSTLESVTWLVCYVICTIYVCIKLIILIN